MALVTDFTVILGEEEVLIGDDPNRDLTPVKKWSEQFLTPNRAFLDHDKYAILTLGINELTASKSKKQRKDDNEEPGVPVSINGTEIGKIREYFGYYGEGCTDEEFKKQRAWDYWYTQTIAFKSKILNKDEDNTIEISGSPIHKPFRQKFNGVYEELDDFMIKSVICWYKQLVEG